MPRNIDIPISEEPMRFLGDKVDRVTAIGVRQASEIFEDVTVGIDSRS